jgi:hypothetical protein
VIAWINEIPGIHIIVFNALALVNERQFLSTVVILPQAEIRTCSLFKIKKE